MASFFLTQLSIKMGMFLKFWYLFRDRKHYQEEKTDYFQYHLMLNCQHLCEYWLGFDKSDNRCLNKVFSKVFIFIFESIYGGRKTCCERFTWNNWNCNTNSSSARYYGHLLLYVDWVDILEYLLLLMIISCLFFPQNKTKSTVQWVCWTWKQ